MYYPASQIKTNLYTNGAELVFKSNNSKYIGYYWKTSDGKYFTGKTPQDKNIQELIQYTPPQNNFNNPNISTPEPDATLEIDTNSTIIDEYNKLNGILINVNNYPTSFNPAPTQDDYDLGEFTRYFCKKTNELRYIEINKDTFEKLLGKDETYLWQLFVPFKYQWIISGDEKTVYKINKNTTSYIMNKLNLFSFNKFLKEDYLKFWK